MTIPPKSMKDVLKRKIIPKDSERRLQSPTLYLLLGIGEDYVTARTCFDSLYFRPPSISLSLWLRRIQEAPSRIQEAVGVHSGDPWIILGTPKSLYLFPLFGFILSFLLANLAFKKPLCTSTNSKTTQYTNGATSTAAPKPRSTACAANSPSSGAGSGKIYGNLTNAKALLPRPVLILCPPALQQKRLKRLSKAVAQTVSTRLRSPPCPPQSRYLGNWISLHPSPSPSLENLGPGHKRRRSKPKMNEDNAESMEDLATLLGAGIKLVTVNGEDPEDIVA
ncbi:hypothetical protein DFJ43DRAFT_1154445 [Lentinula guzmanii]|uniref:Uncharacterized protein n=1 Tax=Lentinula guzmanii TaxID=2804957 RepID=A0AA38JLA6_9AGAR|nr:hypothetical protein DFJ43DRAFT_1154445 [Lentinula guzmanii]KAJ3793992.1 hypothetical protein GGU11DRAFT_748400 [Lentinula aff. detonsa]